MKSKILLVVLLMVSNSAVAQWKKIHTFYDSNGKPELISCIYFLDLPGPPRIGFVGTVSELWKTTDGGITWSKSWQNTTGALNYVADICFKDSLTGWFSFDGYMTGVFRTEDGGDTWQWLSNSSTVTGVDGLHFNPLTQTLYLGQKHLGASSDLGDTWDSVKTGTIGTGGFSFFSDSIGIASAGFSYSSTGIIRTTDGGNTWSKSNYIDSNKNAPAVIQPLAIPGTSTCFVSTGGEIMILRSDDCGQTWRLLHDFGPPEDSQYRMIDPGGTGVICGNLSRLFIQTTYGMYFSTDEGLTWVFDGGPMAKSISESSRFYCGKGETFAALDTVAYPLFDGSLWEEIWPNSGVKESPSVPASDVSAFPNPTPGPVTISGAAGAVVVTNVLGERVSVPGTRSPEPGPRTLDLSRLPTGTYFVRIETPGGMLVRKIIKE